MLNLKDHVRTIPDHPKPGILFYDIGTLLAHGPAWQETIARLSEIVTQAKPTVIVGIESRGFLVGAPVAAHLGIGFAMFRKKGKLPGKTISRTYALEYGEDTMEMQEGMITAKDRVVMCDDLLATGGTASAALALARQAGAEVVHAAFVIELASLNGRARLDIPVTSLLAYAE